MSEQPTPLNRCARCGGEYGYDAIQIYHAGVLPVLCPPCDAAEVSGQSSEYSGARELRDKAAGVEIALGSAADWQARAEAAEAECVGLRERVLIEHGRYRAMEALRLQAVQTSTGHLEAGRRLVKAADALRDAAGPLLTHFRRHTTHRCEIDRDAEQALADYERVRGA